MSKEPFSSTYMFSDMLMYLYKIVYALLISEMCCDVRFKDKDLHVCWRCCQLIRTSAFFYH